MAGLAPNVVKLLAGAEVATKPPAVAEAAGAGAAA